MKALVVGKGRMGQLLSAHADSFGMHSLGCCDVLDPALLLDHKEEIDVILDFSHPDNLDWILDEIEGTNIALVEGTTALSEAQKQRLAQQAARQPVFYSANYSYGVAVFQKLLKRSPTFKRRVRHGVGRNAPQSKSGRAKRHGSRFT